MDRIINVLNHISNYNYTTRIATSIAILVVFLILRKVFAKYVINFFSKIAGKTSSEVDDRIIISFEKPLKFMFIVLGLYLSSYFLPINIIVKQNLYQFYRILFIILIAWGFYDFSNSSSVLFDGFKRRMGFNFDKTFIQFTSYIIKSIIFSLTIVLVLGELDYDISGFIAGLGLGGLAFALAAQDTASNIFGGVVIVVDKPFTIGDWVLTPSVEGVVEDINLRSTRIRTFAHAEVIMPNSKLTNEPITNWTRMGKRRITFNIGVKYSTPRKTLQTSIDKIKEMLENHPEIHKDTIFVNFDKFNNSSLDIFLYFFTNTTNWGEFLSTKEEILFKIMEIFEQEQVEFAFPSQSIYIENGIDNEKE